MQIILNKQNNLEKNYPIVELISMHLQFLVDIAYTENRNNSD